jgi:hypothetical protein
MSRKHDTVLKLAMIFSASADERMTIEVNHINAAIASLDGIEPLMLDAFSHIGSAESAIGAQVLSLLERVGGKAPKYLLLRQMAHLVKDAKAFDAIVQTLESQGKLTHVNSGKQTWFCLINERSSRSTSTVESPTLPFEAEANVK